MTDTLTDDDITEVRSSSNRTTTTSSSTTTRRPMYIETEVRTDSVVTRRMASAAANRSVQEVLESTKSPTHDLQSTSYTYAHSNAYAPTLQTTTYEIPVMARRSLHSEDQSRTASLISLPCHLFCTVRSQLANGYGAVRDRVCQLTGGHQQASSPDSPTSEETIGGTRFVRTSSQSSASGSRATGYNLRSRPVHSTPHDNESEQQQHQQRKATKHRKDHHDYGSCKHLKNCCQTTVCCLKKAFQLPVDIFDTVWNKFKVLPWWILVPLIILLTVYALPYLACKPFANNRNSKVNAICQNIQHTTDFTRFRTYNLGLLKLQKAYRSTIDVKKPVLKSLSNFCSSTKNKLLGSFRGVKNRVVGVVETTTDNAKEYYEAGLQRVNKLIEELKQEREKVVGTRHALKPDQEREFIQLARTLIEEYAADETGQADYALEANGGKVVDTRCEEYTDEPQQKVVKFLGIPIVHMSKQPDIIIKHGRMPGQCFPFKGDHGSVVIRLAVPVIPTEFVLEHLSKSISIVGHTNSAPNNFTVYALKDKNDKEGTVLGRYNYDAENGAALQRFKPQIANVPAVEYIEVQITSNWGNPAYTCLYRFRVHGDMQSVTPTAS
ncbi:unnamed protein product [Rotaria magnacalcarata]